MKIPRDIKRIVDEHGAVYTETPSGVDMPPLDQTSTFFINVRDDIAKMAEMTPEDVKLIHVQITYIVGSEKAQGGAYYALCTRDMVDPAYEHVMQEIDNAIV